MTTITASEFSKEMNAIEALQKRCDEILYSSNEIYKWWFWREFIKKNEEAGVRMSILFKKELVEDK